jgi:formylglycine-generating enzyme required for sulfatase activity
MDGNGTGSERALDGSGGGSPVRSLAEGEMHTVPDLGMELVWVAPGAFTMGSPTGEADRFGDETQHHVTLTKGFWLGKHPVTQGEYGTIMGANPSFFQDDVVVKRGFLGFCREVRRQPWPDHPMEWVAWNSTAEFCRRLTERERAAGRLPAGYEYRLPTEAEWEYAARGGAQSRGFTYAGSDSVEEVAWYEENSGNKTHSVGGKKPNELGLYDMSGNVWEWCLDWYDENYYGRAPDTDPVNTAEATCRVARGGGWSDSAWGVRSAIRYGLGPGDIGNSWGFRLALATQIVPQ